MKKYSGQKDIFKTIFILLTILLILLPFLLSFNEIITKLVERFSLYLWMQQLLVPIEVKMVSILTSPFNINFTAHQDGMTVNGTFLRMTWNCIGWQSLLLLLITLFTGLKGKSFTLSSKVEVVVIGLIGTFLVNLLRLAGIVILFTISRPLYAVVYHDYLAVLVTIIWLFGFWWFSYRFVLEEKNI